MVFKKAIKLMDKYGICPKCGKDTITCGKEGLVVEDDYFERWCECGYRVKVDQDDKEIE